MWLGLRSLTTLPRRLTRQVSQPSPRYSELQKPGPGIDGYLPTIPLRGLWVSYLGRPSVSCLLYFMSAQTGMWTLCPRYVLTRLSRRPSLDRRGRMSLGRCPEGQNRQLRRLWVK